MIKKINRKVIILISLFFVGIVLSGCESLDNLFTDFNSEINGLPMTLSTYDYDGQKIDQVEGKSMNVTNYKPLSELDGDLNQKSKVLEIDYGNHQMVHVGSSMVMAQNGIKNYQDQYNQHQNINDTNPSFPLITSFYNNFKNSWTGKASVLLIRSQAGKAIAVYAGNNVSAHKTSIPSSTKFLIDGKRLFVYRCDYSIYDMSSVQNSAKQNNKVYQSNIIK